MSTEETEARLAAMPEEQKQAILEYLSGVMTFSFQVNFPEGQVEHLVPPPEQMRARPPEHRHTRPERAVAHR